MRKQVLALTTSVVVLGCGALSASVQAQAPSGQSPGIQQGPAGNQDDGNRAGMMGPGMMGSGMMGGGGMMGPGLMGQARARGMGQPAMAPMMMRMMFALMDADGDGKISLQEFQAAHERIFKAIDANKDGFVTIEEMQEFIRGSGMPGPQR